MDSLSAHLILAQVGQEPRYPSWAMFVPFLIIFAVFYMITIRPQQKKAREHDALLKSLRPGDKVVTSSGILAVVVTVKEKSVSIRSADTKLEVLKGSIAEISERSAGDASNN